MTRPGPDHDRWSDSLAPWVLGALPDEERQGFEQHLLNCSACRDEADELRLAANTLPTAVAQMEPGPAVRDRIMRVVHSEADLLAAAGPEADRPPPPRRRWLWRAVPAPLVASALAVGVIAGIVGGNIVRDDGATARTTMAVLASRAGTAASARLVVTGGGARLVGAGLPAPPSGRIYQVWLKRRGQAGPEPTAALFTVTRAGDAAVDVPGNLDGVERVMVTDEPAGGSQTPTGGLLLTVVPA